MTQLERALRVVQAVRDERSTGDHVVCDWAPCGPCEALAAFDAAELPADTPEPADGVFGLGEFPPIDVCITGGIHVWNDAGRCSRCDNWKGNP